MTIRRMKSMSGFRRLWSEYGMEGLLRSENIARFTRSALLSFAGVATTYSVVVWVYRSNRQAEQLEPWAYIGRLRAVNTDSEYAQALLSVVAGELQKRGYSATDLCRAAANLRSVEPDVLITANILANSSHSTLKAVHELIQSIPDPRLRKVLRSALQASSSVSELGGCVSRALVDSWVNDQMFCFDGVPNRSGFLNRETSEALGVDIGCTIGTLFDTSNTNMRLLPLDQILDGVSAVEQWGFALVANALSRGFLQRLTQKLQLTQGPASEVGEKIKDFDKNIAHSRAMVNRLQMIIRGSKLEDEFRDIHSAIFPLVSILWNRRSFDSDRLFLSDVRLVVVDEAADRTNWTMYNPKGGYTVLIPLHDRDSRMGGHEIIPGSHFLSNPHLNFFHRIMWAKNRFTSFLSPVRVTELYDDGCWRAGDALILDNRTLVRADENTLFKSGSYILFKYESAGAATGGLFLAGKVVFRLAHALEAISRWGKYRD
jgi:hypothetical protein